MTLPIAPIIIGGPTASGKTDLSLKLVSYLKNKGILSEIICADSITIFKKFEIGSAKPTPQERAQATHHMIDLANPDQSFTAGDYTKLAHQTVEQLLANKIIPIVVGGTGFYIRALLKGMATGDENEEEAKRWKEHFEERGKLEGWQTLYREVLAKDPGAVRFIHENDHYRIVRALQAMELHQEKWSELNKKVRSTGWKYPAARYFCLNMSKDELQNRISERTQKMLQAGLVQEVESLVAQGYAETKPMQSVGYKECLDFVTGKITQDKLSEAITHETLRLTKRQMTWFRGEEKVEWLEKDYYKSLLEKLEQSFFL